MRLIDMKRTGLISNAYYRLLRGKGYSDNLNIPIEEIKKMFGTDDLTGSDEGQIYG